MDKKIRWIIAHPLGKSDGFDKEIKMILESCKEKDTKIDVVALNGRMGPEHLEYHFYEDMILIPLMKKIRESEESGFDTSIIGCFYDPGLQTAREITNDMIVAGPAESSMNLASTYGHKFSIIVGRKKWIPQMENNVVKYGFKDRLASFRSVGLGVLDFHEDPERTTRIIKEEAIKAVEEDQAEVIILGCTKQYGFYKELQEEIGVPVIDTVVAPFKFAEFLAELKNRFDWKQSKIGGYESPPEKEIRSWNLYKDYDI